jgi:hypothetical protein
MAEPQGLCVDITCLGFRVCLSALDKKYSWPIIQIINTMSDGDDEIQRQLDEVRRQKEKKMEEELAAERQRMKAQLWEECVERGKAEMAEKLARIKAEAALKAEREFLANEEIEAAAMATELEAERARASQVAGPSGTS